MMKSVNSRLFHNAFAQSWNILPTYFSPYIFEFRAWFCKTITVWRSSTNYCIVGIVSDGIIERITLPW